MSLSSPTSAAVAADPPAAWEPRATPLLGGRSAVCGEASKTLRSAACGEASKTLPRLYADAEKMHAKHANGPGAGVRLHGKRCSTEPGEPRRCGCPCPIRVFSVRLPASALNLACIAASPPGRSRMCAASMV